jgi:hypothetical protein
MLFFCCHILLSQEQHSIDVLLSLSCPTSTKDKVQYILYPLLSCLASTRTTFNICLVLAILFYIHKNKIQYMFYFLFSYFHNNNTPHVFFFYFVMFLLRCLMSIKKRQHLILCILLSWLASAQTTLCVQWQDQVSITMATLYKKP